MTFETLIRQLNLTEANLRKMNKLYVLEHSQFKTIPELLDVLLTKEPEKILKSCTVKVNEKHAQIDGSICLVGSQL